MPAIPVDTGLQVAPSRLDGGELNAQVTTAETGGAVAEGIQKAGGAATDIAMQMKQKVDTIQALNADTAFGTAVSTALYDPETGVRAIKGQAAAGRYAQAQQDLTDQQNKIADGLQNQTQRAEFMRSAMGRMEVFRNLGGKHVAEQTEVAEQDAYAGQLKLAQTNGVAAVSSHGADEPAVLAHGAQETADAVRAFGTRHGMTEDQIVDHQQLALGQYHTQITETMLEAGLVPEAKAWFDVHQDQMDAKSRNDLGKKVGAAVDTQMIQDKVGAAMDSSRVLEATGGAPVGQVSPDVDGGKAYAALLTDPDLQKHPQLMAKATENLRARLGILSDEQRASDEAAAKPMMTQIVQGRGIITPAMRASMEAMPARVRNMLESQARDVANPSETDPVAFGKMQAFMSGSPEKFSKMTANEVQDMMSGLVSHEDQKTVWGKWNDLHKGKDPGEVLSVDRAVTLGMTAAGIKTDTKAGAQKALDATDHLNAWSKQIITKTGNVPEPAEYAKELGRWAASTGAMRPLLTPDQVDQRVAAANAWTEQRREQLRPDDIANEVSPEAMARRRGVDWDSLRQNERQTYTALFQQGLDAYSRGDRAGAAAARAHLTAALNAQKPLPPHANRKPNP